MDVGVDEAGDDEAAFSVDDGGAGGDANRRAGSGGGDSLGGDHDDGIGDGRSAIAVDESAAIDDGGLGDGG